MLLADVCHWLKVGKFAADRRLSLAILVTDVCKLEKSVDIFVADILVTDCEVILSALRKHAHAIYSNILRL